MLFSLPTILLAAAGMASTAAAASMVQVPNFGTNPSGAQMYIYVPDNVKPNPAIVVGVHWCSGTAQAFYTGTGYKALADQYGFIVIYPNSVVSGGCWDVASTATLTHNGGGDSLSIRNMVGYAVTKYSADTNRIFVTGHSSGGMMTNVLMGAYPDVFKAGAAFAGVPFACFAGSSAWNSACANGQTTKTAAQWGDLVRNAYPGFTGTRPRMQLWHGTNDETLNFHNFDEAIKQWTNVAGISQTPTSTEQNAFAHSGWVRTKYGTQVEAVKEQGQPHNLQILADQVIAFFGLNGAAPPVTNPPVTTPPATTPPATTPPATTPPPTTTPPASGGVPKYGQCGGLDYKGPTNCIASTCVAANQWYSQCL